MEPSCVGHDAPCPNCGHLLFFPEEKLAPAKVVQPTAAPRSKRAQGQPTKREPAVQAERLIKRLIRRATPRLGAPGRGFVQQLETVEEPYQAERLLALLHDASSWGELLVLWRAEASAKGAEVGKQAS